jgi:hydrogenase/urease accessory protein HupE
MFLPFILLIFLMIIFSSQITIGIYFDCGVFHLPGMEIHVVFMAGVTGRLRVLTPPRHLMLIPPLVCPRGILHGD